MAETDALKKFSDAREQIASALAMIQQNQSRAAILDDSSTSFDAALQEAIFAIDSDPDTVDPYLDTSIVAARELGTQDAQNVRVGSTLSPFHLGKLQRLRSIKVSLFGGRYRIVENGEEATKETLGIIAELKALASVAGQEELG